MIEDQKKPQEPESNETKEIILLDNLSPSVVELLSEFRRWRQEL